jgi:aspartyl protease family protein
MDSDDGGRLLYLGIILVSLLGYFVIQARARLGQTMQQLAIWALIFLGAAAGHGLWQDLQDDLAPRAAVVGDGVIRVPAAPDGHYYLTATVDGAEITFVVDTGASDIVLTAADAARAGIDTGSLAYLGRAQTANGMVATAPVTLGSVTLGGVTDQGVRAVVNGGDLDTSLLGMSYLARYDIAIADRVLTLRR